MFTLGINEFIRNFKKNILVIIQLIVVYTISIFMVSAFMEQYRLMDGVSGIFDDTGIYMMDGSSDVVMVNITSLEDNLTRVESITQSQCAIIYDYLNGGGRATQLRVVTNDPEYITYTPELIAGEWCEDAPHEDGVINVVVSNNMPFEFNVGEKVDFGGYTFKITGVVETNEMIYGINHLYEGSGDTSYLMYYESVDQATKDIGEPYYLLIASYGDAMRELSGELYGAGNITIDFEDDITEEELEENIQVLRDKYSYSLNNDMRCTDMIYDHSVKLLEIKYMPLLIILLVVISVLVISLVISGAINLLYEKKNYGIYFICGNNWKNTFLFSAVSWSTVAVASIAVSVLLCLVMKSISAFDGLAIKFCVEQVWVIGGITVVLLGITLLITYTMLRKIQPVSILKENNK